MQTITEWLNTASGFIWGPYFLIPLLLGVGVVYSIHMVHRVRGGELPDGNLLRTGTARAVLLSALTLQSLIWWLLPLADKGTWIGAALLVGYGASAGAVPTCLFAMPSRVLGAGGDTASGFGIIMTGRNLGVLVGPAGVSVGGRGEGVGVAVAFRACKVAET